MNLANAPTFLLTNVETPDAPKLQLCPAPYERLLELLLELKQRVVLTQVCNLNLPHRCPSAFRSCSAWHYIFLWFLVANFPFLAPFSLRGSFDSFIVRLCSLLSGDILESTLKMI